MSKRQTITLIIISLIVLAMSFVLSIIAGSTYISPIKAVQALFSSPNSSSVSRIIHYVRLPRTLAALLAGLSLSVSGVIIQAVLNNSLAAPNIIGVNAGAGFTTLLIIGIFPGMTGYIPIAAIAGALLTSLLIYGIACRTGASRITITLAGIAISSMLTAGMNTIKTFYPDSLYNASTFLIGGFMGVSMSNIGLSWILILIGIIIAFLLAKDIDLLLLGDSTAKSLGMNVTFMRFILLIIASLLAGSAVSFSGLLGFVGLIIPHIVRKITGNNHRLLIPVSALWGGIFVMICDVISRCLFAPYELPVGIVLSLLGAPFFLFLILQKKRGTM